MNSPNPCYTRTNFRAKIQTILQLPSISLSFLKHIYICYRHHIILLQLKKLISNSWIKHIKPDRTLRPLFPLHIIKIGYKRDANMRDIISETSRSYEHMKLVSKNAGNIYCNLDSCEICKYQVLNEDSKTFRETYTNFDYNILHKLNCQSTWVIYLLQCTKCNAQYVGSTEETI